MTVDYEALGRYHAVLEQYQRLITQRHNLASSIDRITLNARISGSVSDSIQTLDHEKLGSLVNEITSVNQELMHVVEQVNHYAGIVNKPKIKIMRN